MIKEILKTKRGKWAIVLCAIAVMGCIASLSKGTTEALPGALVLIAIAALLVLSAVKSIKNPPPAPTLKDMGINVPEDALQAFDDYGTLPDLKSTPVLLGDNEQAVYDCMATRAITKNRVVGHTRNSSGTSLRIAKGVTLRTGGGGTKSEYGDVTTRSAGRFIITNERIVFSSQQNAFTALLGEIASVEAYEDGLIIIVGKNTYVLELAMSHYPATMIEKCRNITK